MVHCINYHLVDNRELFGLHHGVERKLLSKHLERKFSLMRIKCGLVWYHHWFLFLFLFLHYFIFLKFLLILIFGVCFLESFLRLWSFIAAWHCRKAFIDELALLQKIRHPNVVQFLGAVTQSTPMMIVTEYLPKVYFILQLLWQGRPYIGDLLWCCRIFVLNLLFFIILSSGILI